MMADIELPAAIVALETLILARTALWRARRDGDAAAIALATADEEAAFHELMGGPTG